MSARLIYFAILLLTLPARGDFNSADVSRLELVAESGRVHCEYVRARNGRPTLFFVNGLDDTTSSWRELVAIQRARDPDIGIVLFDLPGQGRTNNMNTGKMVDIPFLRQRHVLKEILTQLNVVGDKYLIGLSYGGGVAMSYLAEYPEDFKAVVAIAPFTAPLASQDQALKRLIKTLHLPSALDNSIYDFMVRNFVYLSGFGSLNFLEPFKLEGIYHLIRGAKDWDAMTLLPRLPDRKLHLVASLNDALVPIDSLRAVWRATPANARASFLEIRGGNHRLPQAVPRFLADWLRKIIDGAPEMNGGQTYTVDLTSSCQDILIKNPDDANEKP